jgi:hypothetical protein
MLSPIMSPNSLGLPYTMRSHVYTVHPFLKEVQKNEREAVEIQEESSAPRTPNITITDQEPVEDTAVLLNLLQLTCVER